MFLFCLRIGHLVEPLSMAYMYVKTCACVRMLGTEGLHYRYACTGGGCHATLVCMWLVVTHPPPPQTTHTHTNSDTPIHCYPQTLVFRLYCSGEGHLLAHLGQRTPAPTHTSYAIRRELRRRRKSSRPTASSVCSSILTRTPATSQRMRYTSRSSRLTRRMCYIFAISEGAPWCDFSNVPSSFHALTTRAVPSSSKRARNRLPDCRQQKKHTRPL